MHREFIWRSMMNIIISNWEFESYFDDRYGVSIRKTFKFVHHNIKHSLYLEFNKKILNKKYVIRSDETGNENYMDFVIIC